MGSMNKIEIRTDDNELYATLDWNPKFAGLPEVLGSILHKSAAKPLQTEAERYPHSKISRYFLHLTVLTKKITRGIIPQAFYFG